LIDEFLESRPSDHLLTLIFTTRSARKSSDTLKSLQKHVDHHPSRDAQTRIHLQPESLELTKLLSVRSLARKLVSSNLPRLDAIVLNAGIGGWSGLDWPMATRTVLADVRTATTWPPFKVGVVGLTSKLQFPSTSTGTKTQEPPLAEVFTANLFGHYMLAHWLMPLLQACPSTSPGRVVWISSIEAASRHYNPQDHQGFLTNAAYEHGKRITDLLTLTHTHPSAQPHVKAFFRPPPMLADQPTRSDTAVPTLQVSHPGIVVTTIVSLYWIVAQAYLLAIYFARWVGAPWSTVSPYAGAASATFLALASSSTLHEKEVEDSPNGLGGQGKWGSSVTKSGKVTVRRTDVDGYGIRGDGEPFAANWWGGRSWWGPKYLGRAVGARDAEREDIEKFVEEGVGVWKEMEDLRVEWEDRLEEWDLMQGKEHGNGHANGHVANGKA
jgi:3-keto steroid reductase